MNYSETEELVFPISGKSFWNVFELEKKAYEIRQSVIKMVAEAKSGHTAGSLGMADVFTALYFRIMHHDPKNPEWEDRDRLILSSGHICPIRYAAMAHAGYFPIEELQTFRKLGSRLQGHPSFLDLPGVETSSGPLGEGLSVAIGEAIALKMDGKNSRIYVCMSDAEQQEGMTWEAAMMAGKLGQKINNLTAFIDRNNIQITGHTEDIMPLEPLRKKYEDFGWHVLEVDGHNFAEIITAFNEAKTIFEKPTLIIFHTIPGKGVSFMENKFEWHGRAPNDNEEELALKELSDAASKIQSEY